MLALTKLKDSDNKKALMISAYKWEILHFKEKFEKEQEGKLMFLDVIVNTPKSVVRKRN